MSSRSGITTFGPSGVGVPDGFTQISTDTSNPELYEWKSIGGVLHLRNLGDTSGSQDKALRWDTPGILVPDDFVEIASLLYFQEQDRLTADVGIGIVSPEGAPEDSGFILRLVKSGNDSEDGEMRLTDLGNTIPKDESGNLGYGEGWYFLRMRMEVNGMTYGKGWPLGSAEPTDWQTSYDFDTLARIKAFPGLTQNTLFNDHTMWAWLAFAVDEKVNLAFPRVRSNVGATVGSLLEATDAPALESNVRESFFEDVVLPNGTQYGFIEALAPGHARTVYYANPTSSQERLAEYVGSTKLGRMADAYPDAIRARALDLVGTATMTAQELLQALFERWAEEFDWFTHKPVPDLRYRVEGDDYTGDRGVLTVPAVLYPQDEDAGRRLSMRQILDEILSIFPGTGILQDSEGDIVLRPTYGPDAPSSPSVTMGDEDAFSISTGDLPDPRRVFNRARVTSRGYEFQEDQEILTPSYLLVNDYTSSVLRDSITTYEKVGGLAATIPYSGVVNTSNDIEVTYTAEIYSAPNEDGTDFGLENSSTDTVTLGPGEGTTITIFAQVGGVGGKTISADWHVSRGTNGLNARFLRGAATVDGFFGGFWYIAHVLKLSATGDAFVQRNESITGRFGYDTTESEIVNSAGENVLENSQDRYGEREITISTDAFALTPEQAQEIAQGLVLHHITPRVVRTVEQSWWRAFPVLPDHIGKIVQLPSGAEALVEERTYTDDYTAPLTPLLASTFRATLTEPVARDPTEENPDDFDDTNLLAFDSGDWLRFDDGTLAEKT